jgi:septum formation topological specificity factor MinE
VGRHNRQRLQRIIAACRRSRPRKDVVAQQVTLVTEVLEIVGVYEHGVAQRRVR